MKYQKYIALQQSVIQQARYADRLSFPGRYGPDNLWLTATKEYYEYQVVDKDALK